MEKVVDIAALKLSSQPGSSTSSPYRKKYSSLKVFVLACTGWHKHVTKQNKETNTIRALVADRSGVAQLIIYQDDIRPIIEVFFILGKMMFL